MALQYCGLHVGTLSYGRPPPAALVNGVLRTPDGVVCVCVFKAPRTYTPVLGALVSPLGTR